MRIAVVAPSSRFDDWQEVAARVQAAAAARHAAAEIWFHPQCGKVAHHFAGTDDERAAALVEVANDPAFDAVWFARGGLLAEAGTRRHHRDPHFHSPPALNPFESAGACQ